MTEEQFLELYSHVATRGQVYSLCTASELPTPLALPAFGLYMHDQTRSAALTPASLNLLQIPTEENFSVFEDLLLNSGTVPDFALGLVRDDTTDTVHINFRSTNIYSQQRHYRPVSEGVLSEDWDQFSQDESVMLKCTVTQNLNIVRTQGDLFRGAFPRGTRATVRPQIDTVSTPWQVFYPRWWSESLLRIQNRLPLLILNTGAPNTGLTYAQWGVTTIEPGGFVEVTDNTYYDPRSNLPAAFRDTVHIRAAMTEGEGYPVVGKPEFIEGVSDGRISSQLIVETTIEGHIGPSDDDDLFQINLPFRHSYGSGKKSVLLQQLPRRRRKTSELD